MSEPAEKPTLFPSKATMFFTPASVLLVFGILAIIVAGIALLHSGGVPGDYSGD